MHLWISLVQRQELVKPFTPLFTLACKSLDTSRKNACSRELLYKQKMKSLLKNVIPFPKHCAPFFLKHPSLHCGQSCILTSDRRRGLLLRLFHDGMCAGVTGQLAIAPHFQFANIILDVSCRQTRVLTCFPYNTTSSCL